MVTFLENGIEWIMCFLATIRLGVVMAPLDAQMPGRPEELAEYLNALKPNVIVVEDATAAKAVDLVPNAAVVKLWLASDNSVISADGSGWQRLSDFALKKYSAIDGSQEPQVPDDQPVYLMFTSGTTTGNPKGCLRHANGIVITTENYITSLNIDHTSKYLLTTVNFRVISTSQLLVTWRVGGTVIWCSRRFGPGAVIRAMIELKVTHSIFVPAFIYAIRAHPDLPKDFPKTFEQLAVTDDIVTEDMKSRAKEILRKQLMFRSGHGMSEGGGLIAWNGEDAFDDSMFPTTEGGIMPLGRARPGGKVKIASIEPGSKYKPVKVGEQGELHYHGKTFIDKYVGDGEPESFYEDEHGRWCTTGDLGMMDEGSFLYILSRIKAVIKCKGVPISPTGLEVVLNTERDVVIKVVGLPHHAYGAVPVAIVRCPATNKRDCQKR